MAVCIFPFSKGSHIRKAGEQTQQAFAKTVRETVQARVEGISSA